MKYFLYSLAICFSFVFVTPARAATIIVTSTTTEVRTGESFYVDVWIDPTETINAIDTQIIFDSKKVRFSGASYENSIISAWVLKPKVERGGIHLSGMIPGGFEGILVPLQKELIKGKLATLEFEARAPGRVSFTLGDTHVYLHDGQGTEDQVKKESVEVVLVGSTQLDSSFYVLSCIIGVLLLVVLFYVRRNNRAHA